MREIVGKPRWAAPIAVLVTGVVLFLIGAGFSLGQYAVRDNAGLDPVFAPAWTVVLISLGCTIGAVGWVWLVGMGIKYRNHPSPRRPRPSVR